MNYTHDPYNSAPSSPPPVQIEGFGAAQVHVLNEQQTYCVSEPTSPVHDSLPAQPVAYEYSFPPSPQLEPFPPEPVVAQAQPQPQPQAQVQVQAQVQAQPQPKPQAASPQAKKGKGARSRSPSPSPSAGSRRGSGASRRNSGSSTGSITNSPSRHSSNPHSKQVVVSGPSCPILYDPVTGVPVMISPEELEAATAAVTAANTQEGS